MRRPKSGSTTTRREGWRRGTQRGCSRALLAVLLLGAVACRGPRRNAEQLVFAVRTLRDAPNAAKALHLQALQTQSCDTQALCEFKARCVEAYELHVDALGRIQQVDPGTALATTSSAHGQAERATERQRALSSLKTATELLEAAHQLTRDCLRHETTIAETFRL